VVSYGTVYTREALAKAKELFCLHRDLKIVLGTPQTIKEASIKAFTKYYSETMR